MPNKDAARLLLAEYHIREAKNLHNSSLLNVKKNISEFFEEFTNNNKFDSTKAPHLVTRGMVSNMKKGSVIVDVSVDQGGCVETIKPTSHSNPVYEIDGVIHYGVTNMPGAVPRTSTFALTNATLPYVIKLANLGIDALKQDFSLAKGVNVFKGRIACKAVADSVGENFTPLEKLLYSVLILSGGLMSRFFLKSLLNCQNLIQPFKKCA